ncbi:hypothetical protein AB0I00_08185 [Streptomyces sp. NPDC050803]|uniref:hypothetical protein n=1 Tax=unclassified Streptomyces TaxID=2593676 RepID=UPI00342E64C7
MSNSYAQPILRTPDRAKAMRVVEELLSIADTGELEVDFEARISSTQALAPLIELLPRANWFTDGHGDASSAKEDDPAAHLPIWLQSWAMQPDIVEPLLQSAGTSPAAIRWDFQGWPEAPEAGLGPGGCRGAFITLCLNARDIDLDEPATDHMVFVHVKQVEAERAPWLAAQVGLRVIGDLVMAPH